MKKNYKRLISKNFKIEKVIKKEGDKLYVRWKVYDNSSNSWIDKKDLLNKCDFSCIKNEPIFS